MGTLRFLLALAVVFAHLGMHVFVGGRSAVQLFYIVSGFLISYVLVHRGGYTKACVFYASRYLRLFPVYAVVAALTLLYLLPSTEFRQVYKEAPGDARVLLVLSNLLLFGQDWIMFLGVKAGQLVPVVHFDNSDVRLYRGLLVPQAWSLGVELTFYLIAPFIVRRRHVLYMLLIASLALRAYLLVNGIGRSDPWTYRFFPLELAWFILGALAHQLLLPLYERWLGKLFMSWTKVATVVLVLLVVTHSFNPLREVFKLPVLLVTFVLLLPFAFRYQSSSRWDNWLGSLSYPIYVSRLLVVGVLKDLMPSVSKPALVAAALVGTVLAALVLEECVGKPVDAWRARIWRGSAEPSPSLLSL